MKYTIIFSITIVIWLAFNSNSVFSQSINVTRFERVKIKLKSGTRLSGNNAQISEKFISFEQGEKTPELIDFENIPLALSEIEVLKIADGHRGCYKRVFVGAVFGASSGTITGLFIVAKDILRQERAPYTFPGEFVGTFAVLGTAVGSVLGLFFQGYHYSEYDISGHLKTNMKKKFNFYLDLKNNGIGISFPIKN